MADYVRLSKTISQFQSTFCCGITYSDFLNSQFVCGFDLTTSQEPGLAFSVPTIRTGKFIFVISQKNPLERYRFVDITAC